MCSHHVLLLVACQREYPVYSIDIQVTFLHNLARFWRQTTPRRPEYPWHWFLNTVAFQHRRCPLRTGGKTRKCYRYHRHLTKGSVVVLLANVCLQVLRPVGRGDPRYISITLACNAHYYVKRVVDGFVPLPCACLSVSLVQCWLWRLTTVFETSRPPEVIF